MTRKAAYEIDAYRAFQCLRERRKFPVKFPERGFATWHAT